MKCIKCHKLYKATKQKFIKHDEIEKNENYYENILMC